jgi:hypothetical protein
VEPSYEVDLFGDDYLSLLSTADLRMDPASSPRPVSSVAFAYLGNTTLQSGDIVFSIFYTYVSLQMPNFRAGIILFGLYIKGCLILVVDALSLHSVSGIMTCDCAIETTRYRLYERYEQ